MVAVVMTADAVPRPRLHATTTCTKDGWTYHADLLTRIAHTVISPDTLELLADLCIDGGWWAELRGALDVAAAVPTDREAARTMWMRRSFPLFLGFDDPDRVERVTGHATCTGPANLTGGSLTVMNPECWGSVPVGFDAGLLHAYGLRVPAVAARVRDEFAHVLDTPAGRIGELAALCEMLQAVARGEYAESAPCPHGPCVRIDRATAFSTAAAQVIRCVHALGRCPGGMNTPSCVCP
ncbi:hypothetical protein [Streptomyces sp. NBC_00105]|uniref:hypothetical protein n=1 Tax=Streptomyces sp. NBC_00105 TaxID=2903622 RepID=UPI00324826E1